VSALFRRPPSDLGEDEQTVVDEQQIETPVDPPQCPECKGVALLDDFDAQSLASFPFARCARAADSHWYCCVNYSKTHVKVVTYYRKQ